ncbi:putative porin [Pelagicoccus sp. SDUM812005]|uniref:putative porin n=1 Tax=Pelagicoccus sp. SDUM812005 TaxID=3041257 RepID=UPI00280F8004|nr:putative porin [Pelagicoccus sp. SDUM812005]MDQ8180458.1 putative porin [Pelagicoccus sp. SDUM812005]
MPSRILSSAASAALALLSLAQTATAYDWEADLIVGESERHSNTVIGARLSYFFTPITHGTSSPWAEIPFTERISDLTLATAYKDQEYSFGYQIDSNMYTLAYNHRNATSPHSYSFAFGYEKNDILFPSFGYQNGFPVNVIERIEEKTFNYGISYSYYLQDTWSVGTSLILEEFSQYDHYSVKVATKRLWDLGNQTWFGLEAGIAHNTLKATYFEDDNISFQLKGSYHLSPQTAFSAELKFPDSGKPRSIELSLQHFLTDSAFVGFAYTYTELPYSYPSIGPSGNFESDDDDSAVQAKIGLRF